MVQFVSIYCTRPLNHRTDPQESTPTVNIGLRKQCCILILSCLAGCQTSTTDQVNESSQAEQRPTETPSTASTETTANSSDPPRLLDDDQLAAGWISLFDGQTLFGWQAAGDADWTVRDGALEVSAGAVGPLHTTTLLHTTTQFSDYRLQLEYKADAGTNSGVFVHTPPRPQDPATDCYEINIAPADNPFPTGSLVKRNKVTANPRDLEWNQLEIGVLGDFIEVILNGTKILEYVDPAPLLRGHIGLQHNEGRVAFRNVRLQPTPQRGIFNGEDLTQWIVRPEMDSEFSVTPEGYLHVTNGKGQIETQESFGDFVLQLECISNGEGLNSGIFFRCIPGDVMMGYESQIHNGFVDGDRARPVDCGTGGIFRRQDARRVVSDDFEWFTKTIIADGPHIATWVNGYQVADWTDTRAPDDNPRRGLRVEPGTIIIQGHDPTTDLSFRNLRISPLRVRVAE